jgi:hypothetical protein
MVGIEMMKEKFYEKLNFTIINSSTNKKSLSKKEYEDTIARLLQLQNNKATEKNQKDYRLCNRFDILEINLEGQKIQRLVKKGTEKRIVFNEVFYLIKDFIFKTYI